MGYVDPGNTQAIIPHAFQPDVEFDITITMIQILNIKEMFVSMDLDGTNMHLENFIVIFTWFMLPRVDQEEFRLRLFSFLLTFEASLWLGELLQGSITT